MPGIAAYPADGIHSAYLPNKFIVYSAISNAPPLVVRIYFNGVLYKEFSTDGFVLSGGQRRFDIDIQTHIQNYLRFEPFNVCSVATQLHPQRSVRIRLEFSDTAFDPDGKIVVQNNWASSPTYIAFNTTIQQDKWTETGRIANNLWMLTNKPSGEICLTDCEFVTIFSTVSQQIKIVRYESNNNPLDPVAVGATVASIPFTNTAPTSVAIGPGNITFGTAFFSTTEYYDIFSTVIPSRRIRYAITRNCCPKFRLHWENPYGQQDSEGFDCIKKSQPVSSEAIERPFPHLDVPIGLPITEATRTQDRFDVRANEVWTLSNEGYSEAEVMWLAELLRTPKAALEEPGTPGQYWPVVVLDSNLELMDNSEDMRFRFEVKVKLMPKIIQIN